MYMCRESSLFMLLLALILCSRVTLAKTNYGYILENQQIDDQLRLLGPEGLLKNRQLALAHDGIVNDTCARDLAIYERAIDQRESWALQMLDASSKLPVGMLQGHVIDMGMFDECMEASGHGSTADLQIHGRHCMYAIDTTLKERFILDPTLSICLPATCNAEDVVGLLRYTINATEKLKTLGVDVVSASCTTLPPANYHASFLISLTIVVAYVAFLVFCTFYDLLSRKYKRNSSGIWKILERLSLLKNAESILDTRSKAHDSNFAVIHGIRAISACWIVLVHEYLVQFLGVNVNVVYITKWISSWESMYLFLGLCSVDTFLALGGFLMTWNFFKQIHKVTEFNIGLYYLHRFIRLTFPMLALFVTTFVLLPGLGASGARYEWLQNIVLTGCGSKWWSVLLYMQNFWETDNYCLLHLWSLSVDMQLYLLSPFVLLTLYKRPRLGLIFLFILILTSAIVSGSIVGANKYSSIYFAHDFNITRLMETFQNVYQMTYTRASPWLIGILFAYAIVHKSIVPSKALIFSGWFLAIASFAFCTLGIRYFTHANYEYNLVSEVTFAALQRPLWAFGICWIIYASIHNAAGPVASLLSAKVFLPISRISYSIYLVHLVLPVLQVATSRAPKHFNQYSIFQSYISNMVLAIVAAFFFSLVFEVPILILEEAMFNRKAQTNTREMIQKTK